MTTEIKEYSPTEAAISDLESRYKGVIYEVQKPEGMSAARLARKELREYRVALEKTRKEIKEPALRRCNLIDSEARRLTAVLSSMEDPIDEQIKAEEKHKDDERLAAERAEQERLAAIERERKEAEERELAAQRAEIARQQEDLRKAEAARVEAERQAQLRIEEQERAARLKIEEEERAARLAREEADRAARLKREAEEAAAREVEEKARRERQVEEDRIRAEREAVEAERKKLREAEEAAAREEQRRRDELMDAWTMIKTFVHRYGHLKEYAPIVKAYDGLKKKETA